MLARLALLLIAVTSGGCAIAPPSARVSAASAERAREQLLAETVLTSAATQVQRCYRAPRVSSEGRQIITQLRIRVFPGGEVRGLPVVLGQRGVTPDNETYAQPMAQAAVVAVVRCAPLTLPDRVYRYGWVDIFLTFSPLARA
jgi:hypothetical protein